jgi:hypothetical protein
MTVDICSANVEMRCGLNTADSYLVRISAFSLSEQASELSGCCIERGESLIRNIDFVLHHRDLFEKERFYL